VGYEVPSSRSMPEHFTITQDLLRISRELMIAEIERFYTASQPIPFDASSNAREAIECLKA
jgi:hypothetical protein